MKFLHSLPEEVELEYRLTYGSDDIRRMIDTPYLIGYLQVVPSVKELENELIKCGNEYFATVIHRSGVTALYTRLRSYIRRINDQEWSDFICSTYLVMIPIRASGVDMAVCNDY